MAKDLEDLEDFLRDSRMMQMGHEEILDEYGVSPEEVVNFAVENNVEYSEAIDSLGAERASMKEGAKDFILGVESEFMRRDLRALTQDYITEFFDKSDNSEIDIYFVRWVPIEMEDEDKRVYKFHVGCGYKDGRQEGENCLDLWASDLYDEACLDADEIEEFEAGLTDLIASKADDLDIYGTPVFENGELKFRHYEPVRATGRYLKNKANRFGNNIKKDIDLVKDYFAQKNSDTETSDE